MVQDKVVLGLGSFLHDCFCSSFFWSGPFLHDHSVQHLQSRSIRLRISAGLFSLDQAHICWFVNAQSGHTVLLVPFCTTKSPSFSGSFVIDQVRQFRWFICARSDCAFLLVCLCSIKLHISAHSVSLDQVAYLCLFLQSSRSAFCSFPHSIGFVSARSIIHQHLSPRSLDNNFPLVVCQHLLVPSIVRSTFRSFANKFLLDRSDTATFGSLLVCFFCNKTRFASFAPGFASSLISTPFLSAHFLLVLSVPFSAILAAYLPPLFGLFAPLPSTCLLQLIPLNSEYHVHCQLLQLIPGTH